MAEETAAPQQDSALTEAQIEQVREIAREEITAAREEAEAPSPTQRLPRGRVTQHMT